MANTDVGSRSSSTRMGDIATSSMTGRASFGTDDARLADAARGDRRAGLVEEGDLAELTELEHVVLEDAVLLPGLEAGVLEVGGERLQQLGVGDDVAADLLGGADGDVLVAVDDRLARAALERKDGDEAVGEQRQDGRAAQQEGEPGRDVPDSWRHQNSRGSRQLWLARGASVTCFHNRSVATISRPGSSTGTLNRLLTARARTDHARKIAGGSSMNACWTPATACLTASSLAA